MKLQVQKLIIIPLFSPTAKSDSEGANFARALVSVVTVILTLDMLEHHEDTPKGGLQPGYSQL